MIKSTVKRIVNVVGGSTNNNPDKISFSSLYGKNLPIYIDTEGQPCFKFESAEIPYRIFILTIPKSGTYLIADILERLGVFNCQVHIALDNIQDNRFASEDSIRKEPWKYLVHIPFSKSKEMIKEGQFSFGHIPFSEEINNQLENHKKLFSYRNMRDVVTSLVRYHDSRTHKYAKPQRLKLYENFKNAPMGHEKFKAWFPMWGEEYADLIKKMCPWNVKDNVFQIKFEALMGDSGEDKQISLFKDLAEFISLDLGEAKIRRALKDSIGSRTITYSGKRSSYEEWWDDSIEELFVSYGFDSINKDFGY